MKKVEIYTDGACSGNPGIGGWAAVLFYKNKQKEISGSAKNTTNNRMELTAIIKALQLLKEPCEVTVYSDSAYSINPFLQNWIEGWILKNWKKGTKNEVKNIDLWKTLLKEVDRHQVNFVKVKGHSDNEFNNRCDYLARMAIKHLQSQLKLLD